MTLFDVLIEGEQDGRGFYTVIRVWANDKDQAVELIMKEEFDWQIIEIDEITSVCHDQGVKTPSINTTFGKTFFGEL